MIDACGEIRPCAHSDSCTLQVGAPLLFRESANCRICAPKANREFTANNENYFDLDGRMLACKFLELDDGQYIAHRRFVGDQICPSALTREMVNQRAFVGATNNQACYLIVS